MTTRRFRRRLRLRTLRLRRLGKLRIALICLLVAAAVAFHLFVALSFVDQQPGDSKLYIQLARNVAEHGVFSGDTSEPYLPTLIRTPGYPFFLLAIFQLFGAGNETAVRVTQALVYTLTCVLAAMIAGHWIGSRELKVRGWIVVFVLTAFCPFAAIYSATILAETTAMFFLAAMLLAATYAIKARRKRRSRLWWAVTGLFAGLSVFFRPDAGLFALGIGLTLVFSVLFGRGRLRTRLFDRLLKGLLFSAFFILPLVPWTVRNQKLFGVFQPLAPAHAEMPGEFVPRGYLLWLRTWIDDQRYIDPLIWNLEIKPLRIEKAPAYAFDSDDERQLVSSLFDQYNNSDPDHPVQPLTKTDEPGPDDDADSDDDNSADDNTADEETPPEGEVDSDADAEMDLKISPEVDAAFQQLGEQRVARHPWNYYLWLPARRSVSMWFDTHSDYYPFAGELLPLSDLDNEKGQQVWLPLFAGLVWIYTILAAVGAVVLLLMKGRAWIWLFLAIAVSLPRVVFFGTIENPEPRYLVELFIPAAILAGVFLTRVSLSRKQGSIRLELTYQEEDRGR